MALQTSIVYRYIGVATLLLVAGLSLRVSIAEMLSYTATEGIVVSTGTSVVAVSAPTRWGWETLSCFEPDILVRYEVDARFYTTDRLYLHPNCFTREEAGVAAAEFVSGSPVAVHYDPDNPAQSALSLRPSNIHLAFSGAFVFMALVVLLTTLEFRPTSSPSKQEHE